jgi:nitrogen fixation protein NifU and related proteins
MNYSKEVIRHFTKPHNYGVIKNPSGVGLAGNPVCGDVMKLYIKVQQNKNGQEIIQDIKFETLGCASAIATSSMITDLAKHKTLDEALKLTRNDVAEALGGLPPVKMHCSNLACEALQNAIEDYRKNKR